MRAPDVHDQLAELSERMLRLEHAAELIKTVLIVKEPETIHAAGAYDGLRKLVVASAGERRSHLNQLALMAVAVRRANNIDDLRGQVDEWLRQAGVDLLIQAPPGTPLQDVFEEVDGGSLEGASSIEVLEPAYQDATTKQILRLGRARAHKTPPPSQPAPKPAPIDDDEPQEQQ